MTRWRALALIEAVAIAVLVAMLLNRDTPEHAPAGEQRSTEGSDPVIEPSSPARGSARTPPSSTRTESSPYRERAEEASWTPGDPVGLLLFGKVVAPDGSPVVDGRVEATSSEDKVLRASIASGSYALPRLAPGRWRLLCTAPAFRALEMTVDLKAKPVSRRLDFHLKRSVILRVRFVTPDAANLRDVLDARLGARVTAVATQRPPEAGLLPLTTDQAYERFGVGRFGWFSGDPRQVNHPLAEKYAGELQLDCDLPVFVSAVLRHVVLETKHVPQGAEEVEFVIPLSSVQGGLAVIKGRVVSADDGSPLAGAFVRAAPGRHSGVPAPARRDGTFELRVLPGPLWITVEARDYAPLLRHLHLESGKTLDVGTLELQKPIFARGRVVDADGRGVRAQVQWIGLDDIKLPQSMQPHAGTASDKDGNFVLPAAPGRYLLRVRPPGAPHTMKVVDVRPDLAILVRLGGPRTVLTLDYTTQPTGYVALHVTNEDGVPIWGRQVRSPRRLTVGLAPGSYTVTVYENLSLVKSLPVTLGSDPVTIVLP